MSYNAHPRRIQQIEQLLTTVVACRGIVKYNLPLNDEQKRELLSDIDIAVDILRSHLTSDTPSATDHTISIAPPSSQPYQPPHSTPALFTEQDTNAHEGVVQRNSHEQQALLDLYRMYHSFINVQQNFNLNTFIMRFNDVMSILHDLQSVTDCSYGEFHVQDAEAFEDIVQRIRVFIADLYSIFMEFLRALSETLQKYNVQLDTEKLTSLSTQQHRDEPLLQAPACELTSLFSVYQAHQRLNEKRGLMVRRISEAAAFLEFLKEGQSGDGDTHISKRDEILLQLNNVGRLLQELSHLLTDYEKATATLLFRCNPRRV